MLFSEKLMHKLVRQKLTQILFNNIKKAFLNILKIVLIVKF